MENNTDLLKVFETELSNSSIRLMNNLLTIFLVKRQDVEFFLIKHFDKCEKGRKEPKPFYLKRWLSLGDSNYNPTLVIVKIDNRFFFGMTCDGKLEPLREKNWNLYRGPISETIIDFFVDPIKYINENSL